MPNLTIDQIIETRLRTWFPTIDIGTAVDIARVRKDLEGLVSGTKSDLLAEGAATKAALLAKIEALQRYEPELRANDDPLTDAQVEAFAEMFEQWRQEGSNLEILEAGLLGDKRGLAGRCSGYFTALRAAEAAMRPVPAGEPASFVSIQDLRSAVA